MLFMITQVHTPQTCPKDEGGADVLINKNAQGVSVKAAGVPGRITPSGT